MKYSAILLLVFSITLTGCVATMGSGSRYTKEKSITLVSVPDSAAVWLDSVQVGVTPTTVSVSNSKRVNFVFTMQGYRDATCELIPKLRGGALLAGIISVPTVFLTGAMITGVCILASDEGGKDACLAVLDISAILSPVPFVYLLAKGLLTEHKRDTCAVSLTPESQ